MKQIKITIDCPFFTHFQIFNEADTAKQVKWMQAEKKLFLAAAYKGPVEKPHLSCTIEHLKPQPTTQPVKALPAPAVIAAPTPCNLPVKATTVRVLIDDMLFEFNPKRNVFINLTDVGHSLTLKEVKGLHALDLLRVPKQYQAAFKYFVN